MIDDDYVIGELRRPHLQAELLLHGGVKAWWGIRVIRWRRYHRAGPSELGELGFVWSPFQVEIIFIGKAGLIDHRLVHHACLHPDGKVCQGHVCYQQISRAPEKEASATI
jgi:hypothetical protein